MRCDFYSTVVRFREAILSCPDTGLVSFEHFPLGACGDASPLLGQFLCDQGHGEWEYISGARQGDYYTHAWIERAGWVVDITADQFPDIDEPVIVTQDRRWHTQFLYAPISQKKAARVDMFDDRTTQLLSEAYGKIMAQFER